MNIPMGTCTSTEDNEFCENGYYYKAKIRPGNHRTVLFNQKYGDVLLLIEGKEEFDNGDINKPKQYWKFHLSCSDEELTGSCGKFEGNPADEEHPFHVRDWSDSHTVTCGDSISDSKCLREDHETCIELEEASFQGRSISSMSQTDAADLKNNPRFLRHLVKYKDFTKEGPSIELWNGFNLAASNETCATDEDDKWAIAYEYLQTHVASKRETGKKYEEDMGSADKVLCTYDSALGKDVATIWMWVKTGEEISENPYLDFDDSTGYCALKFTIICGDHGYELNPVTDVSMAPSSLTDFRCKEMLASDDEADWNDFKRYGYKNLLKEEGDFKCEVKDGKKFIKKISFKQYFSSSGKVRSDSDRRQMRALEGGSTDVKAAVATAMPKATAAEPSSVVDMSAGSADSSDDATQERKLWGAGLTGGGGEMDLTTTGNGTILLLTILKPSRKFPIISPVTGLKTAITFNTLSGWCTTATILAMNGKCLTNANSALFTDGRRAIKTLVRLIVVRVRKTARNVWKSMIPLIRCIAKVMVTPGSRSGQTTGRTRLKTCGTQRESATTLLSQKMYRNGTRTYVKSSSRSNAVILAFATLEGSTRPTLPLYRNHPMLTKRRLPAFASMICPSKMFDPLLWISAARRHQEVQFRCSPRTAILSHSPSHKFGRNAMLPTGMLWTGSPRTTLQRVATSNVIGWTPSAAATSPCSRPNALTALL